MVYLILHKSFAVSHRVSPSRAPVLSFAHYFQAPATAQVIKLRLAITFILNAVNPGSKCTKDVTPFGKTYEFSCGSSNGWFLRGSRNRTEGSVPSLVGRDHRYTYKYHGASHTFCQLKKKINSTKPNQTKQIKRTV